MTLKIELPRDIEEKLTEDARKLGVAPAEIVLDLVRDRYGESAEEADEPAILRLARAARKSVPETTWSGEPTDHARNYKHYLYGHPKEEE